MPAPTDRLNAALEGRYRIARELGEGGMATVYLADDLKHGRKVAMKVLKPELAAVVGAERFLGEIATTANLQHPHILPLFDSGEADSFLFYVMPYVEGETLRDRLDREKQLPVGEAVRIAVAVANAIQAAHEHGVVHRDIKPANILLSRGEPLVADFGIALAVGVAGGNRLTETGLSVGTPFYMSPEQATGDQALGPATDQYALACVLYEMLTGDPPYVGSTAQAVLGKILRGAPARPTETRRSIPPNVDGAILRALEKLPADRFASTQEFARALADPGYRYGDAATADTVRGWSPLTTSFAAAAAIFGVLALWSPLRAPEEEVVSRWALSLPDGHFQGLIVNNAIQRLAISRDGRRLVWTAPGDDGRGQLWLRDRARLDATPIPGTEGARTPSFSPDGSQIAFVIGSGRRELRAVSVAGGPSVLLTDSLVDNGGVSWGYDGYVYYDGHLEGDGLARVPETGGTPERVTMPGPGELWHSAPRALPSGLVLFYVRGGNRIAVVDPETKEHEILTEGNGALWARSGHLVWVTRSGTLMAAPFDEKDGRIMGRPVALAEGAFRGHWGGWDGAISDEGTFLYTLGQAPDSVPGLRWWDPDGSTVPFASDWTEDFRGIALSPDGRRVAVSIWESETEQHVWVRSADGTGTPVRVTFEGVADEPRWTPDGRRLLYRQQMPGDSVPKLVLRDPDVPGRGDVLVEGANTFTLSPAGDWLVYDVSGTLWAQRVDEGYRLVGEPLRLPMPPSERAALYNDLRLSPDGAWLAYAANFGGTSEVEVRPFPNVADGRWPISRGPAITPRWSRDGAALYYRRADQAALVRVPVTAGTTFAFGVAEEVMPTAGAPTHWRFDTGPDGRLLAPALVPVESPTVVVVEGFFRELRERVRN